VTAAGARASAEKAAAARAAALSIDLSVYLSIYTYIHLNICYIAVPLGDRRRRQSLCREGGRCKGRRRRACLARCRHQRLGGCGGQGGRRVAGGAAIGRIGERRPVWLRGQVGSRLGARVQAAAQDDDPGGQDGGVVGLKLEDAGAESLSLYT